MILFSSTLLGIEDELNASIKFEQNLEAMIMNEGYKLHEQNDSILDETLMTQDTDDEEELIELATNFHYPVVSMVSPNLGLIAGSRALQQRVDHVITKKRPKVPFIYYVRTFIAQNFIRLTNFSQKLGFFVKTKEFLFQHYILTKFSCCSLNLFST